MRLDIKYLGPIIVMTPVIVGLATFACLNELLRQADEETAKELQSKTIVAEASDLANHLMEAGSDLFVYETLHSERSKVNYDRVVAAIPTICRNMEMDAKSRPETADRVREITAAEDHILMLMSAARHEKDPVQSWMQGDATSRHQLDDGFKEFLAKMDKLRLQEGAFQSKGTDRAAKDRINKLLWVSVAINFLVALSLAFWFSQRITSRLAILTENIARLSKRRSLRARLEGDEDEIARIDMGFHRMAEELFNAEQRKKEFLQMISHDLRTPLTSIQGTLASALRGLYGELNEKGQDRISDAERDSERLITMINQLLDIERIEAGIDIELTKVSLAEVISRAIESVRPVADADNVTLLYDGQDATVLGDSDRLIRVVVNLTANAIKYSTPESIVTLGVERHSSVATVRVTDSGRGIPKEQVDKIFDRFAQVEKTDTLSGTGLGLAICKAVIDAHRGRIGVISQEGGGSTFWFSLSLATETEEKAQSEGGKETGSQPVSGNPAPAEAPSGASEAVAEPAASAQPNAS